MASLSRSSTAGCAANPGRNQPTSKEREGRAGKKKRGERKKARASRQSRYRCREGSSGGLGYERRQGGGGNVREGEWTGES